MDRSAARVAGLVLAAGASARMGRDKLLLPLGGEPLLRRAVRTALGAGLEPVLVVLPPGAAAAREALAGLGCLVVENPDPARGQGSSLAEGIGALPADVAAAVVLLPDMPRVTAEMIAALVDRWRETGAPLVLSDYGGTQAPPALHARPLLAELAARGGDQPGKAVVAAHRAEAEVLRWPAEGLLDLDTPDDLRRLDTPDDLRRLDTPDDRRRLDAPGEGGRGA
jgi:molybdenum cofactor cytidylyltransferase